MGKNHDYLNGVCTYRGAHFVNNTLCKLSIYHDIKEGIFRFRLSLANKHDDQSDNYECSKYQ